MPFSNWECHLDNLPVAQWQLLPDFWPKYWKNSDIDVKGLRPILISLYTKSSYWQLWLWLQFYILTSLEQLAMIHSLARLTDANCVLKPWKQLLTAYPGFEQKAEGFFGVDFSFFWGQNASQINEMVNWPQSIISLEGSMIHCSRLN